MSAAHLLPVLVLIVACAAPQTRPVTGTRALPAGALKSTEVDAAACLSQGHPTGTDAFARCLLRRAEQRRAGEALKAGEPVKVGDWCYLLTLPQPFICYDI